MRKHFSGYYRPTEEELKGIWDQGIISFDANVLLNMYRYTVPTRDRLLTIVEHLHDQIWLTNQAAFEFYKNRVEVITNQRDAYDNVVSSIIKPHLAKILTEVQQQHPKHSVIDHAALEAVIKDTETKLTNLMTEAKGRHPDYLDDDFILDYLQSLFYDKVGEPYSREELAKNQREAEERFKSQVPPGFLDAKKPESDRYGDVLVWFQLMQQAKQQNKPIIFVTDDKKDDWWWRHKGQTIGPRPELVQEMQETADVAFYMYPPERFMEYAEVHLGLSKQPEFIEEVRELSQQARVQPVDEEAMLARHILAVQNASDLTPIPANYSWTELWAWVQRRGFADRAALDRALGMPSANLPPYFIRHALEAKYGMTLLQALARWHDEQSSYTWAELFQWVKSMPNPPENMADLDRILDHSASDMTPMQIRDELILEHGYPLY